MKLKNRTILITGGTSGISLALASRFLSMGNKVIVTGRDSKKLAETKAKLAGVRTIQSDASSPDAIRALFAKISSEFPDLDVLINNAGIMKKISLHDTSVSLEDLNQEIVTNLSGSMWMTKQFLPMLKAKPEAAIINVSSGLAFVPFPISPVYSATKAGVHAFTDCLRIQLKNTRVQVIELAPPGTDTPLLTGGFSKEDLEGATAMDVEKLVSITVKQLEGGVLEIKPGLAKVLKIMSRVAPKMILNQLAKPVDRMLKN